MLGERIPYAGVPFFWTQQFGLSLRYVGQPQPWDEVFYWGEPAKREFMAFYVTRGRISAVAGCKRDAEMAAVEELIRTHHLPAIEQLKNGPLDLVDLLKWV